MYLVSKTKETIGGIAHYVQRIHAINVANGTDVVTPFVGGVAQSPVPVGAVTSTVVPQLSNGTAYSFTVAAVPNFGAWLARLGFGPVRGFLKGYIDLVFEFEGRYYLLDWKSNWLGNRVEDYSPERLPQTMAEHYYGLQYHLYTVALHLYLKRRMAGYDYDQHFGGVYYLFLRGLDPAQPQFGVFQARPTFQTTNALAQSLLDTSMT
jgi:hypothetical protein